jgi:DNA-binding PucR family transcriptional regulator
LRRLSEVGVVALVLYYVGIFVPKVDDKLIRLADELSLPLIVMPPNRFDCRYGEVISEVLETVFKDQARETYFVPGMLERISQLPVRQRTLSTVMRMLSDRLRYSLLLTDKSINPVAERHGPCPPMELQSIDQRI